MANPIENQEYSINLLVVLFVIFSGIVVALHYFNIVFSAFSLVVSKNGVTNKTASGTYILPWEEIKSYGIVEDVNIRFTRSYWTHHYIYFSNIEFDEKVFRKRMKHPISGTINKGDEVITLIFFRNKEEAKAVYQEIQLFVQSNNLK